ncbi:SRPBCC family protein [Streptomyces bauhiniae]|uniref:SRPBCC family protein n=1 Tax=Streptomyces bauhiniae TaxID=2340725 RepID=A0A7K3QS08_9ACTN|nr:SRPBCC family protein [Streptomyces bauhiniae]
MADSTLTRFTKDLREHPAAERLKDELQNYLQARAQHTVTRLGHRLGEHVTRLGTPGQGGTGALRQALGRGGKALGAGKSPMRAAMTAGTEYVKDTVRERIGGGLGKSGGGTSRSVVISEDIDVGVPVREAYNQWTQFQEFSTFAKGVVNVDKVDDTSSNWTVKVAKSTRSWRANITEQIPDRRISWTTEGAKGTVTGVVTFHRVTDDLTRVLLVLEYFPKGLFEKTGNIWRAQGRRARLDLKLFRKFIMMRGEASDGWRGVIRDGEIVADHDEALAEDDEWDEDEDAYEDSDEEEYDDAYEDEDVEEDEDEDEVDEDDEEFDPDVEADDGYEEAPRTRRRSPARR